jgi:hypothetical protein
MIVQRMFMLDMSVLVSAATLSAGDSFSTFLLQQEAGIGADRPHLHLAAGI